MMGMTEQRQYFLDLRDLAENTEVPKDSRIQAWCKWGRMSRNVGDMSLALREIEDLVRCLHQ